MPYPLLRVGNLSSALIERVPSRLRKRLPRFREIKIRPAQQSGGRSFRTGRDSPGFETLKDEVVDRIAGPSDGFHRGNRRAFHRLKSPMLCRGRRDNFIDRDRGPTGDPIGEQGDLFCIQRRPFRRHAFFEIATRDTFQQNTFFGMTWIHDSAVFAATQDELPGVEAQAAFLLKSPMATGTAFLQKGPHRAGKIGCRRTPLHSRQPRQKRKQ